MKQKITTIVLTLITVLSPLLIVPIIYNDDYNILKFWILLIGGIVLLILLLFDYKI